jgi:hypothetical protein
VARDYQTIEKTRIQPWLLALDDAAVASKRDRLASRGPVRGFVGTAAEAIDVIGQYQHAGVDLLISADRPNDPENPRALRRECDAVFCSMRSTSELYVIANIVGPLVSRS